MLLASSHHVLSQSAALKIFLMALCAVVVGSVLVFDIGGLRSAHGTASTTTSWGRLLANGGSRPYVATLGKAIGWLFLVLGSVLVVLSALTLLHL